MHAYRVMSFVLLLLAFVNGSKGAYQFIIGGGAPLFYLFVAACCASTSIACLVQARKLDR